jgi:predicted esterase
VRPARTALALALVGVLLALAPPSRAAGPWPSWTGTPTDIFRSAQYSAGEWIYTNGLRQARGADADGLERTEYYAGVKPSPADPTAISYDLYNAFTYDFFGAHRAAHNGDAQLPDSLPAGTGEIAEVRLAVEGNDLHVRFLWNAFPRPDAQIATLTFDDGPITPWPHNAKLASRWSTALTVWGAGGTLAHAGGEHPVTVRTGDHTSEARVPLSLLPAGPWTLRGGSGLAFGAQYLDVPPGPASSTAPGSGGPTSATNVWGLLFAGDTPWSFDELSQSRQLSAGVVSSYATVDPRLLERRATRLAPLQHGDLSRLLHSRQPSRDGITKDRSGALGTPAVTPPIPVPDFNVSYFFGGRLQDYAMHVPAGYDGSAARPLVVYLHGYTGLPEEPFHNPTGLVQALDARGWLLASALGRGDWFYRGGTPGEADVLEVIADVSRHYRVDPDRIYLMGHSMGGYGTNNVAMHHPDLFAAVAPAEGTDSTDLHANLRNTPWFEMTAEEDLDTQGAQAKGLYAALSADGYDATLLDYRLKTHEYSSIYDTLPRLLAFFASHRRATRPAVVSWTRPVGQDNPALGQVYDGAWWLRGVEPVAGVTRPTVTVESLALPHAAIAPAAARRTDAQVDEGGPSGRTAAELLQTVPSATRAPAQPDVLRLDAVGARAASVRLADAGLAGGRTLTVRSSTDSDLRLTLLDDQRRWLRVVDGVPTGMVRGTVTLPKGTHTVLLTPPTGTTVAATGSRSALPATGGLPLALAGFGLLGSVLVVRRLRRP